MSILQKISNFRSVIFLHILASYEIYENLHHSKISSYTVPFSSRGIFGSGGAAKSSHDPDEDPTIISRLSS